MPAKIKNLTEAAEKFEKDQAGAPKKVKDVAKARLNAEKKLSKQAERRVDATLTFEKLGIDALFVDEAHNYKKLGFNTNLKAKGIDTGRSKRAFGLKLKIFSYLILLSSKNSIIPLIAHTIPQVNIPSKKTPNSQLTSKNFSVNPPRTIDIKKPTHVDVHIIQLIKSPKNLEFFLIQTL